jgi:ketosteroid isomerase-like protein
MKSTFIALACVVLLSAAGLSAAPNDSQEQRQVLETLDRMAQATVNKDIPTLTKVFHEDLTYGHSTGDLRTKEQVLQDVSDPKRIWKVFKLSEPTVHIYGSTAVVRCVANIRGMRDDGHFMTLWILVKTPQGWQIMGYQSTRLKDEKPPEADH